MQRTAGLGHARAAPARSLEEGQSAGPAEEIHERKSSKLPTTLFADLKQQYIKTIHMRTNTKGKVYEYDHESLLSWRALLMTRGPVYFHKSVWIVIPNVLMVAGIFALLISTMLPNAAKMDTSRFNSVATYIRAFIAIVLGLFLQEAFGRWWRSVSSFKKFLTAIKQLMYNLHAVGIRDELIIELQRLSIASSFILHHEVHLAQMTEAPYEVREERWFNAMRDLAENGLLMELEQDTLRKGFGKFFFESQEEPLGVFSLMIWTWIGDVMSQVRVDPIVAPPMYVRLLFLCEACIKHVEDLKTNLTVQIPFYYTHFLAWLVHIANLLTAVCCGLALGSALNEAFDRSRTVDSAGGFAAKNKEMVTQLYGSLQVVFMQMVILFVQPVLYQSVLMLANNLNYPYGEDEFHMPTESFIEQTELDLKIMCESAENFNRMRPKHVPNMRAEDTDDSGDEGEEDEYAPGIAAPLDSSAV